MYNEINFRMQGKFGICNYKFKLMNKVATLQESVTPGEKNDTAQNNAS